MASCDRQSSRISKKFCRQAAEQLAQFLAIIPPVAPSPINNSASEILEIKKGSWRKKARNPENGDVIPSENENMTTLQSIKQTISQPFGDGSEITYDVRGVESSLQTETKFWLSMKHEWKKNWVRKFGTSTEYSGKPRVNRLNYPYKLELNFDFVWNMNENKFGFANLVPEPGTRVTRGYQFVWIVGTPRVAIFYGAREPPGTCEPKIKNY